MPLFFKWNKPAPEDHILCDAIYMKYLEEKNLERQNVGSRFLIVWFCVSFLGGEMGNNYDGYGISFWGENVLKLVCGDGYTILWIF